MDKRVQFSSAISASEKRTGREEERRFALIIPLKGRIAFVPGFEFKR